MNNNRIEHYLVNKSTGNYIITQNQKNEINNKTIHRFNAERPHIAFSKQVKGMLAYMIIQKALNKQTIHRNYA